MPIEPVPATKHEKASADRKKHTEAVLTSAAKKKVVVAGPGTGKTHLFKEVIRDKQKTLTLTFINALVDDLSLELCGLSDVKTLHSFARSELARCTGKGVDIFPGLADVIAEDAAILLSEDIDFDTIFHTRDEGNPSLEFYKRRKNYYGSYYGLTDIVFAIARYYETHPIKIPVFDQVVVDEFQDFNKLEVSLLDQLASKNPILLAGDDDQALYDFKKATADFVRARHSGTSPGYEPFTLPYCSRSTEAIVNAANDLIKRSIAGGLLVGRIAKRYDYFPEVEKDKESARHPKLSYHQQFASKVPWLIERELGEIAKLERKTFTVLVISPNKVQIRDVVASLRKKGLKNISFEEKKSSKDLPSFADGMKLLLNDKNDNLGWRICSRCILDDPTFSAALTESNKTAANPFSTLVSASCRKEIQNALKHIRAIAKEKTITDSQLAEVLRLLELDAKSISQSAVLELIAESQRGGDPALKRIPLTATTVQSSKGLAADYVFITHFDDRYFIGDRAGKPSDRDVCSFLVALTRARKKVFLISTDTAKQPKFLEWIETSRIEFC